jgi:hypothetical protein
MNPLPDKHERPAKRIDCGSGKYVALSEGGTFALYYPDGDLCRYLDPYLESELADRLISLVSAGTSVEAQLDRVIASHETYENAYRAFRDLAVWGKTEYKPISDEDRELALSCYRLGHGSPISTGEFTKHPRCANGCETARKWGTKPCEGFCEWLPQKTASPIDAGTSVRDGGTYEESLRELLDFWRTFPGPSNERKAVDLIEKMHEAVAALYFAAYWHPDRKVDEAALWTAVRDAAGIKPGQTGERLGPDRSAVSHGATK